VKCKFILIIATGIVIVSTGIFIAAWVADEYNQRDLAGRLSFNALSLPSHDYIIGDFTVQWQTERGGTLSINPKSKPEKVIWQSVPGESFIGAARGLETVKEGRGFFSIKDDLRITCGNQTIDKIWEKDGRLNISGVLSGDSDRTPYLLTLTETSPEDLNFIIELQDAAFNRIFFTYASEKEEHFFGFGEQFSSFDMKGKRFAIFSTEKGVGRGEQPLTLAMDLIAGAGGTWYTSYAGVPYYITSRMHSIFLDNYEYSVFDLRKNDRVQVQVWSKAMSVHILNSDTPISLIGIYTERTGRMRPLPDWMLAGAVIGMQGGTEEVKRAFQELESRGTPVAAFWLQDWVGQRDTIIGKQLWWNWEVDESHYPGWSDLVSYLDAHGIRMMVYVNPYLVDVSGKAGSKRNLFREANEKGYLVRNRAGEPYLIQTAAFQAGLLDLSNPHACSWWKGMIKDQVIGSGAKGWMADFGEALPYDAILYSGDSAPSYHNRYPEAWARLNREAIEEAGLTSEAVFFIRSGYTHSPRWATLFWEGDQLLSWSAYDGIKSSVTGLLSSGISGFSLNHSDIGGFMTMPYPFTQYRRSKELLLRWMEMNAFTTVFRTHEGNLPDLNTQFCSDNETYAHFSRCARLYAAWKNYRAQLVQEASNTGLPVVRHPFIHYPEDTEVYKISYQQFMLGSEFMVAPVLDEGKASVTVYLPAGEWVQVWSGAKYGDLKKGSYVTLDAPLGKPAVLYKVGSKTGEEFRANIMKLPEFKD
jgi:alpha-glucosidase